MRKDGRYINAGTVEIYKYGKKAIEIVKSCLKAENGFISIPVDGGKYYTIGTSEGKYGEYAKFENTFFSVNSMGVAWAKIGTNKEKEMIRFINAIIDEMNEINKKRMEDLEETFRERGELEEEK